MHLTLEQQENGFWQRMIVCLHWTMSNNWLRLFSILFFSAAFPRPCARPSTLFQRTRILSSIRLFEIVTGWTNLEFALCHCASIKITRSFAISLIGYQASVTPSSDYMYEHMASAGSLDVVNLPTISADTKMSLHKQLSCAPI